MAEKRPALPAWAIAFSSGKPPDAQAHPDLFRAWFAALSAAVHASFIDGVAGSDTLANADGVYGGLRNALRATVDAIKSGEPPTSEPTVAENDDVPVAVWWRQLRKNRDERFAAPVAAVSAELTAAADAVVSVGGIDAPNAHLAAVRLLEWRLFVIGPSSDTDTVERRWPEIRQALLPIGRLAEWPKLAALMEREHTLAAAARLEARPDPMLRIRMLMDAERGIYQPVVLGPAHRAVAASKTAIEAELAGLAAGQMSRKSGDCGESATATQNMDKKTQALAALLTIGPNASRIARTIGVPRSTLLGWPVFRLRYDQVKADGATRRGNIPRGYKSKGDIEAYENEDDEADETDE